MNDPEKISMALQVQLQNFLLMARCRADQILAILTTARESSESPAAMGRFAGDDGQGRDHLTIRRIVVEKTGCQRENPLFSSHTL